jgi:hypothetical protein
MSDLPFPLPRPRRRGFLALAAAGAFSPLRAMAGETAAGLLAAAEQALRGGRPEAAAGLFERASRLDDESAASELGMMRAWLQAGDYARAAAWGRLVAGEHPKSAEAAAWADEVDALARGRSAAVPAGVTALPGPAIDAAPLDSARRLGCGLVDGARQRLLAAPALARRIAEGGAPPWIVDGTGGLWRMVDADGRLRREAPADAEPPAVARMPALRAAHARPGRPVLVLHAAADGGWPRLATGLLTFPAAGEPRLGLASAGPAAPDGSAVFDACGHWLGWVQDGRLEPAPLASDDATSCAAGPAGDVASLYGHRYAGAAVVWRPA